MGFSDLVQWWEEWQLRFLVLSSLFLQFFLLIAATLRKLCIPSWFRFLTWLSYLGSDAIAIYALATLFNRHKRQEWVFTHLTSVGLEALWAPILLLHLGGQNGITAYNIEDNELWKRHVLTMASQIAVAIYVFRRSWSGDNRLLQAAILLFITGIANCLEKPWALKNASINGFVNRSASSSDKEGNTLGYVRTAVTCFELRHREPIPRSDLDITCYPYKPFDLFVDIAPSYSDRLNSLKYFLQKDPHRVHYLLRMRLSRTFDRLYTNDEVRLNGLDYSAKRCGGNLVRMVVILLTFAAIGLFHNSHREAYNDIDVKVTYILLCCTATLGVIPGPIFMCTTDIVESRWPDQLAQYNLIGYLVRNKKHRRLRKLATLMVCKDYLDQLWCMAPCESSSSCDITMLVYHYIRDGWEHHIKDIETYRAFNDNRGQWTLDREERQHLRWSLRRPFDESVLIWHLATDFCFRHTGTSPSHEVASRSREISNYMAYLLFVKPEMLMTGARRSLFRATYRKLKHIELVGEGPTEQLDEEVLTQKIIHNVKGRRDSGIVHDAWRLAKELMGLDRAEKEDEQKMWKVIQGVWVEMLCFSAGRCRGFLHAKSLGGGGEYLSYVWLLLSYMGMETLAEKMQRTELQDEGDEDGAAASMASTSVATATGDQNV